MPVMGNRIGWASGYIGDEKHGPLPALLLGLTLATGLVDAVSILALGRVFVANMTGNVVFIGFAAAGAPGFSLSASLSALAGFLLGALVGGVLTGRFAAHRAVPLRNAVGVELLLLLIALLVVAAGSDRLSSVRQAGVAAAAALRHGNRTTLVRRLLAVAAMFLGAAAGALLVLHLDIEAALAASVAVVAAVFVGAALASRSTEAWSKS